MMIPKGFEEAVNARRIPCECLPESNFGYIHFHLRRGCSRYDPSNSFRKSMTLYIGINKVEPPSLGVLRWICRGHLPLAGGFEPATSSVRWIKSTAKDENSCWLPLLSPKITKQPAALLASCFSISVPELYTLCTRYVSVWSKERRPAALSWGGENSKGSNFISWLWRFLSSYKNTSKGKE